MFVRDIEYIIDKYSFDIKLYVSSRTVIIGMSSTPSKEFCLV